MFNILSKCKTGVLEYASGLIPRIVNNSIFWPPYPRKSFLGFLPESFIKAHYDKLESDFCSLHTTYLRDEPEKNVSYMHMKPSNTITDKVFIMAHGIASDIYTEHNSVKSFADNCGANVFCFDYIGYGMSHNETPTVAQCLASMECVVDDIIMKHNLDPKNIILMGQSLGTGIVVDYALKYDWKHPIMLVSPYKSIINVVTENNFVVRHDVLRTIDKVDKLQCYTKIIHGKADWVIQMDHGEAIYEKLIRKLEPVWLDNIGHLYVIHAIYPEMIKELLDD